MRRTYSGENNPFFGKKHSETSKEKMRIAHLGKKAPWISELFTGRTPWHAGKTKIDFPQLSNAGRKKGSIPWDKGKKIPQVTGKNHYRWIEDRTQVKRYWTERNNPEYKQWRKTVRARDGKCLMENENCSGYLIVHHILGWTKYPEKMYDINNGITLCQAHHPRKRAEEERLVPVLQSLIINCV